MTPSSSSGGFNTCKNCNRAEEPLIFHMAEQLPVVLRLKADFSHQHASKHVTLKGQQIVCVLLFSFKIFIFPISTLRMLGNTTDPRYFNTSAVLIALIVHKSSFLLYLMTALNFSFWSERFIQQQKQTEIDCNFLFVFF